MPHTNKAIVEQKLKCKPDAPILQTHATIEVTLIDRLKWSLTDGIPYPDIVGNRPFFFLS